MKKVLALVVAAAMDLSSAAFATETATTLTPTAMATETTPVKATHHRKQYKVTPTQRAQATKKHHKNAKAKQKALEQKTQATKKHAKKYDHQQPAKPTAQPAA